MKPDVTPSSAKEEKWHVAQTETATGMYATREEAVAAARKVARGEVIVHEVNGEIATRYVYPYLEKRVGVCGGEAVIEGTRITVWQLVDYYYRAGMTIEEIAAEWEQLTAAHVLSALAYYHENRAEIDLLRQRNSYDHWLAKNANATVNTHESTS